MIYKQCKFRDYALEDDGGVGYLGGIAVIDGNDGKEVLQGVICGCCGGFVEADDIVEIKYFDDWIDLCDTIIGDEGE